MLNYCLDLGLGKRRLSAVDGEWQPVICWLEWHCCLQWESICWCSRQRHHFSATAAVCPKRTVSQSLRGTINLL